MGWLNLGKVGRFKQRCRQIQGLCYLLQSQGSRGSPKRAESGKIRALMLQEASASTSTGEKRSKVGMQPGSLPYSAPKQGHEHRWPSSPLTRREGKVWGDAGANAICCCLLLLTCPAMGALLFFLVFSLLVAEPFLAALHSSRCFCFL